MKKDNQKVLDTRLSFQYPLHRNPILADLALALGFVSSRFFFCLFGWWWLGGGRMLAKVSRTVSQSQLGGLADIVSGL